MKEKVRRGGGRAHSKADVYSQMDGKDPVDIKRNDDSSFPVKVQGAGVEPFEMQIHGFWLVQDAMMTLLSRDEICPRSNLMLTLNGTILDPLAEMQSIKGLKPGAVLRLVEEPYTAHAARVHLARILELLRTSGPQDALREGRSPSVLETLTLTQTPDSTLANGKSLKRSLSSTKSESVNQDIAPPDYLLPGSAERPLMALLPQSSQPEVPSCLRDLSLSCWNPPPGHRKLQGDFQYITAVTMEGQRFDITSCPKGFFVNRSTEEVFDPRPAQSSPVCHCFTDLLCHMSPAFKQSFTSLKNRLNLPPIEALPTPYHTLCWLGPPCVSRANKNSFNRLGVDEHSATQAPDWNEELQSARDLPQTSLEERLRRDRAMLKVNGAFVRAVMQGAENVVDGFVEPANGSAEDPAFLWGGLFMSQGAASAVFGGDRGRRAAQRLELKGVQAYSDLEEQNGLRTLPTAIVNYRGMRLSAQGLAPGLEGSEQDQENPAGLRGLLYGVNAGPQESPHRRKLLEFLAQSAKALSIQRHVVVAPSGHKVPMFTSVDAQGLLGADGRFYLLDVFRSFPTDANYCPEVASKTLTEEEGRNEGNEEKKQDGLETNHHSDSEPPQCFPHSLCRLRQELIQAFIQHKHNQFTSRVKEILDENGGFEECATACDSRATDAVRVACKEVGSLSEIIFEMRLNPNVLSPGVVFPQTENESTKLQERLLREAAAFIITHQIPNFVEYCLQNNDVPMDGATLKKALHQRGINLRYLGHVIKAIHQSKHKEQLRHIMRLVISEVFIRSARRVFNSFLQGVDVPCLAAAVSHFLCCLLVGNFTSSPVGEDSKKRSRRRGRGPGVSESTPWSTLTGSELWNLACQDATETYNVTDSLGSGLNQLVERYGIQKISLLREFCLKTGVQLRLRDYFLDSQSKAPIGPDDILNIFPIVKHIHTPIVDATKAYLAAQNSLAKGLLEQAHERLKEAAYLFSRVCDDLHPLACHCNSLLAKVAFLQGKIAEARSVQLKTVVIGERVLGYDHPITIQQYVFLAIYVHAGGENNLALKCLFRARLLALTIHGEDHPYIATLDSCLGLMMTGDRAEQFLKNALRINTSFFGPTNLYTAINQHLLSQWMCGKGDYRNAMTHEKEALNAFNTMFGEGHPQTLCSAEFLGTITKQAVRVERSLRQAGAETVEQMVECVTPTSDTIVEQLGLITGIRRIAQSDKFQEYKQRHKELKAAVARELANKFDEELFAPEITEGGEKATGCGGEVENGRSQTGQNTIKSQQENGVNTVASANCHAVEPGHEEGTEANEENGECRESTDSGVVAKIENGQTAEGACEHNGVAEVVKSMGKIKSGLNGVNGAINGALEITGSPSVPQKKGTWADIVSKPTKAHGTGDKGTAVNGVEVVLNGTADV